MSNLIIYCDGASQGNPGKGGAGVVITNLKGEVIKKVYRYLGRVTNNVAEYQAFILALLTAKQLSGEDLIVFSDSQLLVRQLTGEYKVRNKDLISLFFKARRLLTNFRKVSIKYVDRSKNKEADQLAALAIKRSLKK